MNLHQVKCDRKYQGKTTFFQKRHADYIDLLRGAEKKTRQMATTFMLNSGFENGVFQAFRGLKSHLRIIKI